MFAEQDCNVYWNEPFNDEMKYIIEYLSAADTFEYRLYISAQLFQSIHPFLPVLDFSFGHKNITFT